MSKSLKRVFAMVLVFCMVMMTACGQQGANEDKQKENQNKVEDKKDSKDDKTANNTGKKEKVKAVLVTDQGGVNDKSFNQSAYEGMKKGKEEGWLDFDYIESHNETDYVPNLGQALDSHSDIIWSIGYALYNATKEAAQNNPDQKYAIIDNANIDKIKNLVGVTFADHENSFLVGYIAGMTTKTNNVGFVGGQKSAVIDRFEYGYRAGVMTAAREKNATIEVQVQYADSYNDVAKGKTIANQMYQKGADVIFQAAGGTGFGVIESAKENKKWVIGVDRDQSAEAPENMLVSTVKGVNVAVLDISKGLLEGKFKGGETVEYHLDGGGIQIAYAPNKLVSEEVKAKVEKHKQDIISGTIKVPQNEKEFQEMGYGSK